jgi:hypothetical protein
MPVKKTAPVDPAPALVPDEQQSAVQWAQSILWAAERVNDKKITQKQAGTLSNYTFWKYGRADPKSLLVTLVPKALAILDKNKTDETGSDITAAEERSIAEQQELLDRALSEAEIG